MPAKHLPQDVQAALRMETMATTYSLQLTLQDRRPSDGAALLALVGAFHALSRKAGVTDGTRASTLAALTRALDTLCEKAMQAAPAEVAKARAFAAGTYLPQSSEDVLKGLRGLAIINASSINDEKV